MFIEDKFDWKNSHNGRLWALELNVITKELLNIFKNFFSPSINETDQVVRGINLLSQSNLWLASETNNNYVFARQAGLPVPEYMENITGNVRFDKPNIQSNPTGRFLNKETLEIKYQGKTINTGGISSDIIYMYVFEKNTDGLMFINLYPLTLSGDVVQNVSRGTIKTIPHTLIVNNRFLLDEEPNGDIIFNKAEVFFKRNGVISGDYDVKRVQINPDNRKEVIILDDNDGIDVNGRYAVVSYSI